MARLPTKADIPLPSIDTNQAIVRVDPSGAARGYIDAAGYMTREGQAYERLASGIQTGIEATSKAFDDREEDEIERKLDDFEWDRQTAFETYTQEATDVENFASGWEGREMEARREFFDSVPDALKSRVERLMFSNERKLATRAREYQRTQLSEIAGSEASRRIEGQNYSAGMNAGTMNDFNDLTEKFVKSQALIRKDTRMDFGLRQAALEANGKKMVEGFLEGLDWSQREAVLRSVRASRSGGKYIDPVLIQQESGRRVGIVNSKGFAGMFQFGAPRLSDLKGADGKPLYKPANRSDVNPKTWNKSSRYAPNKWTGEFNIPGFKDVKTLEDFLDNPEAQRKAYDIHMTDIDAAIDKRGWSKYIGETIGGVDITRAGIRYATHFSGEGGAGGFLTSDGLDNRTDGAAKVSHYFRLGTMAANNGGSPAFAFINDKMMAKWKAETKKQKILSISEAAVQSVMEKYSDDRAAGHAALNKRFRGEKNIEYLDAARARYDRQLAETKLARAEARDQKNEEVGDEVLRLMLEGKDVEAKNFIPADLSAGDYQGWVKFVEQGIAPKNDAETLRDLSALKTEVNDEGENAFVALGDAHFTRLMRDRKITPAMKDKLVADRGNIMKGTEEAIKAGRVPVTMDNQEVNRALRDMGVIPLTSTNRKKTDPKMNYAERVFRSTYQKNLEAKQDELGKYDMTPQEAADVLTETKKSFTKEVSGFFGSGEEIVEFDDVAELYMAAEERDKLPSGTMWTWAYQAVSKRFAETGERRPITPRIMQEFMDKTMLTGKWNEQAAKASGARYVPPGSAQ